MRKRKWLQRGLAIALTAAMCFGLAPTDNLAGLFTVSAEGSKNLLTNGDFETLGENTWTISDWTIALNDSPEGTWGQYNIKNEASNNSSHYLDLSNYKGVDMNLSATQTISLAAGSYTATIQSAGVSAGTSALALTAVSGTSTLASQSITLGGWDTWSTATITFTLENAADVTIGVTGTLADSSYCDLDNATLTRTSSDGDNTDDSKDDAITITPSATTVEAGKSIDFTATVTYGGKTLTDEDLGSDLHLYWWADNEQDGHTEGKTDITGQAAEKLSQTITFPSAGTYYLVTDLQDSSYKSLKKVSTTITVTAKEEDENSGLTKIEIPNGGFETGDTTNWKLSGFNEVKKNGDNNTTYLLNLWLSDSEAAKGSASYTVALTAGTYQFSFDLSGAIGDGLGYFVKNGNGDSLDSGSADYTSKWDEWNTYYTKEFTLTEDTKVTFSLEGTIPAEGWGYLDNLVLKGTGSIVEEEDTSVISDIYVEKVSDLSEDFIMGMDISSVMSEFASGVTYKDFDGNTIDNITDFCKFLASCGVTTVRVRVWNDPKDSAGNSYGGGANDVATAVEIAKGCKAAGLDMLIDFHCSDFWTDPGKQQAPKAWADFSLEEKEKALAAFIKESLEKITATGATVSMVQVGNETTSGFIGETSVENMCALFSAGAAAVRAAVPSSKVVIHVTNPEKSYMTTWAKNLADNKVDYDVLATSYYPSWHGTFANLKSQMQAVRDTYGKEVMVAETSYAYTLEDTDGHTNTIRLGTNDTMMCETQYPFSVQGQASYLRDLINVVSEAGGIGVFYWEPAWITVGDTTNLSETESAAKLEANKALWEKYGSGWASSYAAGYDPDDAGKWYGGSAVDNQALFAADGSPLASINIWSLVKTGAISRYTSVESIASCEETIEEGGSYTLPATVTVTYNNGDVDESVSWDEADVKKIAIETIGTYVVNGTVTFGKEVDEGEYSGQTSAQVTYTLTVKAKNLSGDDWSFENGGDNFDGLASTGKGIDGETPQDGKKCLHWYQANASEATVTYLGSDKNGITLEPGEYTFEVQAQGYAGDTVALSILEHGSQTVIASGTEVVLTGWEEWKAPTVSFEITSETTVDLQMNVGIQAGGWGTIDCMYLYQKYYTVTSEDGETLVISGGQITVEDTTTTTTDEEEEVVPIVKNLLDSNTTQKLLDAVLTSDDKEVLKNDPTTKISIWLEVSDQDSVSETDKKSVEENASADGYKVGYCLDIQLLKNIGNNEEKVTELAAPISIDIKLPAELINTDSAYNRTYGIIRVHYDDNGVAQEPELLPATVTDGILTFETDRFSTYAIVYKDTAVSTGTKNPSANQNQQNKTDTTKTNAAETVSTADTTANTAPDTSAATTAKVTSAATGDNAPVIPYVILFAAAFALVAAMGYRRRSAK